MFRLLGKALLGLIVLGIGYLVAWPTPVEPVAWEAPAAPPLTGDFAPNDKLVAGEHLARDLAGPEAVTFDASGRVVTGLLDGRIVAIAPSGEVTTLADTGGRPLGLKYAADGALIVADADRGLLRVPAQGPIETLAVDAPGGKLRCTDDVAIAADGTIYFTDASSRFTLKQHKLDLIERGASGRVLAYDPKTQKVELLAKDLYFANGIALGPGDAYLVVTETSAYQLTRIWLTPERRGKAEPFVSNLPGFPDNVTFAPARGVFWVAFPSTRLALVDRIAPYPFVRKMIARLPPPLMPKPVRHGLVLGFDENGRVVHNLQDPAGGYSPITSAVERDGFLYLGSYVASGIWRVKAP